ncbi:MAG: formyltetrahydrofolate deformylase [Promicromonosporaceae bacterium]|nr:formyltetrahydrofolate deformylase [Promicromonosporaceae bacterium]
MTDSAPPAQFVLTLSCEDRPGIVASVSGALAAVGANIIESQQFGSLESGRFFMRVQFASAQPRDVLVTALTPTFDLYAMDWGLAVVGRRLRTILLVSKAPHCLVDLLYRERHQGLEIDVVAVVGNHPDLADIAKFYGKPFHHLPVTAATKPEAEAALRALITELDVEFVVLARYMQILSDELCGDLAGRIINIHHSFLPSFKGARPYAQAHARGVKLIGATAHYVTGDLDEGPIIEQDVERVDHSRGVSELQAMGEDVERRALMRAVKWHAQQRILLDGSRTVVFR